MNLKLSEQTFQFSCYITPEESKGGHSNHLLLDEKHEKFQRHLSLPNVSLRMCVVVFILNVSKSKGDKEKSDLTRQHEGPSTAE